MLMMHTMHAYNRVMLGSLAIYCASESRSAAVSDRLSVCKQDI